MPMIQIQKAKYRYECDRWDCHEPIPSNHAYILRPGFAGTGRFSRYMDSLETYPLKFCSRYCAMVERDRQLPISVTGGY